MIIADAATQPSSVYDPGLLLGAEAKDELGKASKKKKKPAFSKSDAVTSILVSSADKSIYVIQNGDIVAEGKAEIADPGKKLGSNVFILEKGDEDGFTWQATGYSTGKKAAKPSTSVVRAGQAAGRRAGRDRRAHEARHGVHHHRSARHARDAERQGLHGDGFRGEVTGAESESETRDNTRHLTVRLHLLIATAPMNRHEASHARAWVTQTPQCSALLISFAVKCWHAA